MIPLDDQFLEALDPLSPRERKVLRLRFGLENGRLMTYEDVGREFGVSPGEIEPIEQRALRKLSRNGSGKRFIHDLAERGFRRPH
jgi:RNA polymerase primary sigma factor